MLKYLHANGNKTIIEDKKVRRINFYQKYSGKRDCIRIDTAGINTEHDLNSIRGRETEINAL